MSKILRNSLLQQLLSRTNGGDDDDANRDSNLSDDDDRQKNEEDDEEERLKILQREKIRQYQLNRLKYYYAVVECDSPETANGIYEACDGVEYESSATKIDLRFIPDDTSFDEDTPSDEATDLGDLNAYKPLHFRNAALQQSKVELTWDETSDARKDLMKSMFENQENLDQLNLKGILASGSSDDEDEEEETADNKKLSLKSLVKDLLQKKKAKSDEKEESFFVRSENEDKSEETKPEKSKKSSSWQRYLEKRREKRQQQRQEEKETVEKSKKLNCLAKNIDNFDDLPAGIDMNDPYFKEELDKFDQPTELPDEEDQDEQEFENDDDNKPSYKKTKNMQSLVDEKLKRIVKNDYSVKEITPTEQITDNRNAQKNEASELNLLIKKVKSKTNVINSKKKKDKLAKN
uniref:NUC153 domain-containing protein n=1 Tax=Romanomermis culicivorax TaxID=13658 RepID=A0A915J3K1_ROMCU